MCSELNIPYNAMTFLVVVIYGSHHLDHKAGKLFLAPKVPGSWALSLLNSILGP